jgi:hypothetical protein
VSARAELPSERYIMPENIPLQQRAGRNIGVQVLPPYLHDAAMPEIAVNPTGVTTIMEGKDEVVRTPSVRVFLGNFGAIINQTALDYLFEIFFVDNQNNELKIGEVEADAGESTGLNLWGWWATSVLLGLCLGEKIILRGSLVQN